MTSSLFDSPSRSSLGAAAEWLTGTLLGTVAVMLCVLAVAFVGVLTMSGRLAIRDGLRVVLGCFVLLGAATIASGLRDAAYRASSGASEPMQVPASPETALTPAPAYDPYAGASMRSD